MLEFSRKAYTVGRVGGGSNNLLGLGKKIDFYAGQESAGVLRTQGAVYAG